LAASLADWDRASRLKKAFVLTTAAIATLSFLYGTYLYCDYRARMPSEPQQERGRTYPLALSSRTYYTTKTEQRRYYAARYIFFASVITLGVTSWIEWRRSLSRAA
jgi:hypothetical protein